MQRVLFLLCTMLTGFSACVKDAGNYNYTELPPVTITNMESTYRVFLLDSLNIPVEINTTIPESQLEYNWMIGTDTLSHEKAFHYKFEKEAAKEQQLIFEVRNKTNDVRYVKRAQLSLVSPFQTGWAILSEKDNKGYLSFLSYEKGNLLYPDIYQSVNKEALGSTPISVKHLYAYDVNRISVLCKDGKSVELDGTSMSRVKYYQDEFKGNSFSPSAMSIENFESDRTFYLFSGGKIYPKIVNAGTADESWYQYPLNGDAKDYRVNNAYAKVSYDYYVAFDELNHRYVRFIRSSYTATISSVNLVSGITPAFDPEHVNGSCVWMGLSSTGKVLSMIRGNDGKYSLQVLKLQLTSSIEDQYIPEASYSFADGAVTDQSCFAAHGASPYLFIGTGNNLSALNLEALAQGSAALNFLRTYNGQITAIRHAFSNYPAVNDMAIGIKTNDAELPGTVLLVDPALSARGAILKQVDKVGGVIKSICNKPR